MNAPSTDTAGVCRILLEIPIDAPKARVWDALVNEANTWFAHEEGPGPDGKTFHVQARVGGMMYEDWGDGNGLLWGHVIFCNAPTALHVAGDCSPAWGGPNRGIMIWELDEADGTTVVRFEHAIHGNVSDQTRGSYEQGWKMQLVDGLKKHVESKGP